MPPRIKGGILILYLIIMANKKKPGAFYNIIFNIVIPVLIMTKYSKPEYLGPIYGLVIALVFPIGYGLWEFIISKDVNFISILGFVSVLLTGILGIFQFNPFWIAVKEAAVPLIIGLAIIISESTKFPIVKKMLYNDSLMEIEKINSILIEQNKIDDFNKLMKRSGYLLSISFFVSSILNYTLAVLIVKSQPGTVAYTQEIGRMTALSFPVIAVPSMLLMVLVLFYIIRQIKKLTDFQIDEIFISK